MYIHTYIYVPVNICLYVQRIQFCIKYVPLFICVIYVVYIMYISMYVYMYDYSKCVHCICIWCLCISVYLFVILSYPMIVPNLMFRCL